MNYFKNYNDYSYFIKQEILNGKRPKNKKEWNNWKKNGDTRYFEFHHIIPKCFGGKENLDNYIPLTAREHFLSHYLLCKIYFNDRLKYQKMILAFKRQCKNHTGIIYMNSKLFEKLRNDFYPFWLYTKEIAEKISKAHKGRKAKNKGIPASEEAKEKNRIAHLGKKNPKQSNKMKGRSPWNKGIKMKEESKKKVSESLKLYYKGRNIV